MPCDSLSLGQCDGESVLHGPWGTDSSSRLPLASGVQGQSAALAKEKSAPASEAESPRGPARCSCIAPFGECLEAGTGQGDAVLV